MRSRAWTCAFASIVCMAGAWADEGGDDEQRVIVIQKEDAEVIRREAVEVSREVIEEVRAALDEARREMRDAQREGRHEIREGIRVEVEGHEELGDALRELLEGSHDALQGAGEAVRELVAQGVTGWSTGAASFLAPQVTFGDSGAGNARAVDETRSAAGVEEIDIHNIAGRITIEGWDQDQINVKGSIGEDVEELIFEVDGSSAEVRVKVPNGRRNLKIRSELTISVPKRLRVEARTVSGGVQANNIQGEYVRLETVSGGVDVTNCTGDIEASTTSGGVKIENAMKSVRAECVSGGVTVSGAPVSVSAESISGSVTVSGVQREVEASSVSGRLSIFGGPLERLDAETVSGGLDYEGGIAPNGRFDVGTVSGGVRLSFVDDVSAEFDLQSFSGGIDINLPGAPTSAKREISFSTGDGRGRVEVEAFSGGIRIDHK